jgi:hypothetical protein
MANAHIGRIIYSLAIHPARSANLSRALKFPSARANGESDRRTSPIAARSRMIQVGPNREKLSPFQNVAGLTRQASRGDEASTDVVSSNTRTAASPEGRSFTNSEQGHQHHQALAVVWDVATTPKASAHRADQSFGAGDVGEVCHLAVGKQQSEHGRNP